MEAGLSAGFSGRGLEKGDAVLVRDEGGNLVFDEAGYPLRQRETVEKKRGVYSGGPKFLPFLGAGDAEEIGSPGLSDLRDFHGSVAVGVRFQSRGYFYLRAHESAEFP